ncbi:hypothetical protein ACFFTM_07780 [Pseudoduganella plicata]|uniref:Uncharacterized protein n=1 Tax=Pseudoduganella plicata TaxID=321984 RepID=A0AA88C792_9BURK|nr:hypothetical protein [Pseudoduganella plicata]GGY80937.1 hypothetical protein GCM10007388_12030 [Pseudoduganella plicata]
MLTAAMKLVRTQFTRLTSRNRKALRDMPPGLYEYWARTAPQEFKGIPTDAFFYVHASDALLTFFECIRRSNRPCALPSKAADSVWHAWMRHAPKHLDSFCQRHYGQRIPHVEAANMKKGMQKPMAMCLVTARTMERLDLAGPNVPRLFATDRRLRMPFGSAYRVQRGHIVYSPINRNGQVLPQTHILPGTDPEFLLAAGLIAQGDYDRWLARCQETGSSDWGTSSSSSSCGGSSADFSGDDAGSCDSNGDGGSGDGGDGGSSCGGGCGGGGGGD